MPKAKDMEPNTDSEGTVKALPEGTEADTEQTEVPKEPDFEFMSGPRRNVYVFG